MHILNGNNQYASIDVADRNGQRKKDCQPKNAGEEHRFVCGKLFRCWCFVVMALFLAEASMRVRYYHRYGDRKLNMVVSDPVVGRRLRPNAVQQGSLGTVRVNSEGFRGDELSSQPRPGVLRIVCLGSSTVYGGQMDDDLVFPAVLQHQLCEELGTKRIEVINAGVPGMTTRELTRYFAEHVANYSPQVVVIYAPANDIGLIMREDGNGASGRMEQPSKPWLSSESCLYTTIRAKASAWNSEAIAAAQAIFPANSHCELFKDYQALVDCCIEHDSKPILVAECQAFRANQPRGVQRRLLGGVAWGLGLEQSYIAHNVINEVVRDVAMKNQLLYIDSRKIVPGGREYFLDGVHLTPKGHEILARGITEVLLSADELGTLLR